MSRMGDNVKKALGLTSDAICMLTFLVSIYGVVLLVFGYFFGY